MNKRQISEAVKNTGWIKSSVGQSISQNRITRHQSVPTCCIRDRAAATLPLCSNSLKVWGAGFQTAIIITCAAVMKTMVQGCACREAAA